MRTSVIRITGTALALIRDETARATDGLETGGILLGHNQPGSTTPTILIAGDPGPRADRGPHHFLRDLSHAQALAQDAWTGHQAQWIGEWHTHPRTPPTPSDTDLRSYAQHLEDDALGFHSFISLIVGASPDGHAVLTAWIIREGSVVPAQLRFFQPHPAHEEPDDAQQI